MSKKQKEEIETLSKEASFGQSIVLEAQTKFLAEKENSVISKVTNYLRIIGQAEIMKERYNELIKFNKEKIAALENGKFSFSSVTGVIKFNDDKLNKKADDINDMREWLSLD